MRARKRRGAKGISMKGIVTSDVLFFWMILPESVLFCAVLRKGLNSGVCGGGFF